MNGEENKAASTFQVLFVICLSRCVKQLVDEFEDWFTESEQKANVSRYGITEEGDGFIILRITGETPDRFKSKLKDDEDILDFVVLPGLTFVEQEVREV